MQQSFIESVAVKRTKEININGNIFTYTRLNQDFYEGFTRHDTFFIAIPEKELMDACYLMSLGRYKFDVSTIDQNKFDQNLLLKTAKNFQRKSNFFWRKMDIFQQHEVFEIEVLEKLKNNRYLESLAFGRGTMLRMCHDLPRYSADLDFWIVKEIEYKPYFNHLRQFLEQSFELTDAQFKHNSLLFEFRSGNYNRRLKIEIRKEMKECDF